MQTTNITVPQGGWQVMTVYGVAATYSQNTDTTSGVQIFLGTTTPPTEDQQGMILQAGTLYVVPAGETVFVRSQNKDVSLIITG